MPTAKRTVHGVGVNDANYQVIHRQKVNGKIVVQRCPFYQTWASMLERCYSKHVHARQPTYKDCTVTPAWHYFSNFKAWMETQDWEGKQLDKDVLFPGNKTYSPETCVFISHALNAFLSSRSKVRDMPTGVVLSSESPRPKAQTHNPFTKRREHLGFFDTPEDAHRAWRKRKHELACRYADEQTDPRIATALRTRYV